jgi:hypothetical protein
MLLWRSHECTEGGGWVRFLQGRSLYCNWNTVLFAQTISYKVSQKYNWTDPRNNTRSANFQVDNWYFKQNHGLFSVPYVQSSFGNFYSMYTRDHFPDCEAGHSLPSGAKVQNWRNFAFTLLSMAWWLDTKQLHLYLTVNGGLSWYWQDDKDLHIFYFMDRKTSTRISPPLICHQCLISWESVNIVMIMFYFMKLAAICFSLEV